MRIAIFGASGRTGRHLVQQAVAEGHRVTAIVRNPDGLPSNLHDAVRWLKADVMDPDTIAPALADADTAVSTLSGPGRAPSSVWSESTRSIVQAMREASVRRYIAITGSMLDATGDGLLFRYIGKPIADPRKRSRMDDHPRATPDRQAGTRPLPHRVRAERATRVQPVPR